MNRKLASVQRVVAIRPIENADAIEIAQINGWQCVVKKGEFQPGDLGAFLEIDAIPPDVPAFRFLWTKRDQPSAPRPEKFRIKTMRLRGALSQGLLLPLGVLGINFSEGDDLTERLGVGKWEPPAPTNMGDRRGPFPSFIPKTDEMRVQSVPQVLDELKGHPWVATLKCDGTSATFYIDPETDEFHVCSRNHSVKDGDNLYWAMAREYDIEGKLRRHPSRIAIQGEICGPGIQKNPLGLASKRLFVFNVYDLEEKEYYPHSLAKALCAYADFPEAPVVFGDRFFDESVESLLDLASGVYEGTSHPREGIVVRPALDEMFSETLGGRLSFKVINNDFLLKEASE